MVHDHTVHNKTIQDKKPLPREMCEYKCSFLRRHFVLLRVKLVEQLLAHLLEDRAQQGGAKDQCRLIAGQTVTECRHAAAAQPPVTINQSINPHSFPPKPKPKPKPTPSYAYVQSTSFVLLSLPITVRIRHCALSSRALAQLDCVHSRVLIVHCFS